MIRAAIILAAYAAHMALLVWVVLRVAWLVDEHPWLWRRHPHGLRPADLSEEREEMARSGRIALLAPRRTRGKQRERRVS